MCGAGTQRVGGLTEAQLAEELNGTRNLGLPEVRLRRRFPRLRVSLMTYFYDAQF